MYLILKEKNKPQKKIIVTPSSLSHREWDKGKFSCYSGNYYRIIKKRSKKGQNKEYVKLYSGDFCG